MNKIYLILLLGMVSSALAAGDKDVRHVATGIVDHGFDYKCRLKVHGVKNKVGRNNWDMVIQGFGPKDEEITISECRREGGAEFCAKVLQVDLPGNKKVCQMDRVIYGDEDKGHPASATFERIIIEVKDEKSCSETYIDRHAKKNDRVWSCSTTEKRD